MIYMTILIECSQQVSGYVLMSYDASQTISKNNFFMFHTHTHMNVNHTAQDPGSEIDIADLSKSSR